MYNLRNQQIDFFFHPQYIKPEVHNGKLQRSRTEVGDLIMNIVGPPLGKLAIIPSDLPESNFNQAAVLIRPYVYKKILVHYLFYYLSEMSEINSISTKGSAGQVNISLTQSQNMRIALPPLNEQVRIVEEVRKWFTYVNAIENNSCELEELIGNTKQSILRMEIQGKLVKQNPSDEPAIELLKRINPDIEIPCDNPHYPFDIPQSWCWVHGSQVFVPMQSCTPKGNTFKYIDIDTIDNKNNNILAVKILPTKDAPSRASRFTMKDDTLFSMVRPYLRNIAMVQEDDCIASTGFYFCRSNGSLLAKYCFYMMLSSYVVDGLNFFMKGDNSPSINRSHIESFLYPLPPLSEQKRIVSEIERYFNALDKIKESLTA